MGDNTRANVAAAGVPMPSSQNRDKGTETTWQDFSSRRRFHCYYGSVAPFTPQSLVLPGPNAAVCHDVGTIDPLFHFLAARHVMFFYFLEGYHVALLHTKRLLAKSNGSLPTSVGLAVADAKSPHPPPFFLCSITGQGQYSLLFPSQLLP